ncbi:MAG: hypothetical protein OIN83_03705 [Candidatus Methanoperedens sp.]|nr:hypothetical protein [Candidatus Methanoperedens sp.]
MIKEQLIKIAVSKEYRTKLVIVAGIILAVVALVVIADPAAAAQGGLYVCADECSGGHYDSGYSVASITIPN